MSFDYRTSFQSTSGRFVDMTGLRFGKLVAIEPFGRMDGVMSWYCQCDCGSYCFESGKVLRAGERGSCGVLGCEQLIDVVVPEMPSKRLRRDPETGCYVDASQKVRSNARPEPTKIDDGFGNLAGDMLRVRYAKMAEIKPGDTVKFAARKPVAGLRYAHAKVLEVRDDCFVIDGPCGIRRLPRALVRLDEGMVGNEAI